MTTPTPAPAPAAGRGRGIVIGSWVGTAVFSATAAAAVADPEGPPATVAVVVALVLFLIGSVVFLVAFIRAVSRSRTDQIAVASLFLFTPGAPTRVRLHLLGSWAVQIAVALVTAGARPFTSLAFGILVPVHGLALAGLWGARHGTFSPRPRPAPRRAEGTPVPGPDAPPTPG